MGCLIIDLVQDEIVSYFSSASMPDLLRARDHLEREIYKGLLVGEKYKQELSLIEHTINNQQ